MPRLFPRPVQSDFPSAASRRVGSNSSIGLKSSRLGSWVELFNPRPQATNSLRLQRARAEAGIAYAHHKELAPTTELRHLQYAEDARQGVGKRSRVELAAEYRWRFIHEILDEHGSPADSRERPPGMSPAMPSTLSI